MSDSLIRQLTKPIRAYHGSPHHFDRFDSSKIGTGEGNQAYGYGLYFAGNEDVAKYYRDALAPKTALRAVPRELLEKLRHANTAFLGAVSGSSGLFDADSAQQYIDVVKKQIDAAKAAHRGAMYEVDIDIDPDSLIYGDRPVKYQSPQVIRALKDLGYRTTHGRGDRDGLYAYKNVVNKAARNFETQGAIARRPEDAVRLANDYVTTGLSDGGVQGMSYLDYTSRRRGYGSSNYVVFPDAEDAIKILRKYGIAAPIAAAASQSQGAVVGGESPLRAAMDRRAKEMDRVDGVPQDTRNRKGQLLYEYLEQQGESPESPDRLSYAKAVDDSLNRPVISVNYASQLLGEDFVSPDRFPGGYMSVREYVDLEADKSFRQFVARFKEVNGRLTPEAARMAAEQRDALYRAADDAEGILAGTLQTEEPRSRAMHSAIVDAVVSHAPGGQFAQPSSRTQSEQEAIDREYGPQGRFILTAAGRQNYEAQRLSELWSATSDDYLPASPMSQVQRAVGGLVSPVYGMMIGDGAGEPDRYGRATGLPRLAGEEWDEMGRISKPDGKYGHAAEVYYRGADDVSGESSTYTPEGRAKFLSHDMTAPQGFASATAMNVDFPLAGVYQNAGMRGKEIPSTIGNYLGGGDPDHTFNLRDLRQAAYRTTPVRPDGADPQQFDDLVRQITNADQRMSGYNSAQLGPKIADLYNAATGDLLPDMDRAYLPPIAEDALEVPMDLVTDPVNAAMNAVTPGASLLKGFAAGGMTGAGRNLIGSLSTISKRLSDDLGEEFLQGAGLQSAVGGIKSYFLPQRSNALTGGKNPNDPDYESHKNAAAVQGFYDKQEAAKKYRDMR